MGLVLDDRQSVEFPLDITALHAHEMLAFLNTIARLNRQFRYRSGR